MDVTPKKIKHFQLESGEVPYQEWYSGLKDKGLKGFIFDRLDRLERGSFGKTRWVGPGVWELKIKHGPGYRIYYGRDGDTLVILLCGGDKSTQDKDIAKAIKYWEQYNGGQK